MAVGNFDYSNVRQYDVPHIPNLVFGYLEGGQSPSLVETFRQAVHNLLATRQFYREITSGNDSYWAGNQSVQDLTKSIESISKYGDTRLLNRFVGRLGGAENLRLFKELAFSEGLEAACRHNKKRAVNYLCKEIRRQYPIKSVRPLNAWQGRNLNEFARKRRDEIIRKAAFNSQDVKDIFTKAAVYSIKNNQIHLLKIILNNAERDFCLQSLFNAAKTYERQREVFPLIIEM